MKRLILVFAILLLSGSVRAEGSAATPQADTLAVATAEQPAIEQASQAATAEAIWEEAAAAYNSANYDQAIEAYMAILAQGKHSAKLYYNLANAHFKKNELGKAILYYNRALRLKPGDEDIRHNLAYAESSTKDSIEAIPEFFLTTWVRAIRSLLSGNAWTILSLVMLALALGMALLFMLAQRLSLRKVGFYVMAVAGILFIVTTLFAISERKISINHSEAIVMSSSVSIKSSPDRAATELFVLHEGTKLTIGETIEGWAEVRIADGRKGWIETSRIEKI